MAEVTLTVANFEEEALKCTQPVLIDFWASWCGPCMMLSPIIKEIAEEYDGKLKVGKINTDDQPALAAKYGISSIPTVLLMKDGIIADMSIGYRPKEDLVDMITPYL